MSTRYLRAFRTISNVMASRTKYYRRLKTFDHNQVVLRT
jgi:hypothetical protein